jgi:hypothetical protein
MEAFMKAIVRTVAVLGLGALFGGCVGYPYDYYYEAGYESDGYYETEWVTYEVTDECVSCGSSLDVEVTWDAHAYSNFVCADADLELETPDNHTITAYGPERDGCFHLGNDTGLDGSGREEVICEEPIFGTYEVRVQNVSEASLMAHVRAQYMDEYDSSMKEYEQDVLLSAGESKVISIRLP